MFKNETEASTINVLLASISYVALLTEFWMSLHNPDSWNVHLNNVERK